MDPTDYATQHRITWLSAESDLQRSLAGYKYWADQSGEQAELVAAEAALVAIRSRRSSLAPLRHIDAEALGRAGVPARYLGMELSNFRGLASLEKWLPRTWPLLRCSAGWELNPISTLVLMGPTGTGKTHLATGILRRCLEGGLDAAWLMVPKWLESLKAAIDSDRRGATAGAYQALLRPAYNATVLVLDDLVLEQIGADFDTRTLSAVLMHRYSEAMPTIISTNNTADAIHRFDSRIASRILLSDGIKLELGGRDQRAKETR